MKKFSKGCKFFAVTVLAFLGYLFCGRLFIAPSYAENAKNNEIAPIFVEVRQGADTKDGTPLTLVVRKPLTLTLKELGWNYENTNLVPIKNKLIRHMEAGESYSFNYVAPFDYPSMEICVTPSSASAREFCWRPNQSSDEPQKAKGFLIKEEEH